jgi:hypothetical protein
MLNLRLDNIPDNAAFNLKIGMGNNISQTCNLSLLYIRRSIANFLRQILYRLTNDL